MCGFFFQLSVHGPSCHRTLSQWCQWRMTFLDTSIETICLSILQSTTVISSVVPCCFSSLWTAALKPADALSSLLCTDWPFYQQYVCLWLHWPLPTVQPLTSLPEMDFRHTTCASMQRGDWRRAEGGNASQKPENGSLIVKLTLKNWKCTDGEKLAAQKVTSWLHATCYMCFILTVVSPWMRWINASVCSWRPTCTWRKTILYSH